ncbi:MAG: hypothetical protein GWN58_33245 [Anaerolineae bacterium]|nr:hypothetical protein [Thermoplasmata archaeon]NIV34142.1 hypothetical protein [Anaerolineae bacterium]NIY05993.1 hypothetical protein [Thermoplasmata archaeon]
MKLKGTQEGFDRWITIRDLLCELIEVHPDSMGSQRDVRFWVPFLTEEQVVQVVEAGGYGHLLKECGAPFDVLTDMLDGLRLEAGLSGYYTEEDWA